MFSKFLSSDSVFTVRFVFQDTHILVLAFVAFLIQEDKPSLEGLVQQM
jgi:hypothetical protein